MFGELKFGVFAKGVSIIVRFRVIRLSTFKDDCPMTKDLDFMFDLFSLHIFCSMVMFSYSY